MAIDSAGKRFSMMGFSNPSLQLIPPSGSVSTEDRFTFLDLYNGLPVVAVGAGGFNSALFILGYSGDPASGGFNSPLFPIGYFGESAVAALTILDFERAYSRGHSRGVQRGI